MGNVIFNSDKFTEFCCNSPLISLQQYYFTLIKESPFYKQIIPFDTHIIAALPSFCNFTFFFLERAGELHIIILRRKKGGVIPPKCYRWKEAVTPLKTSTLTCLSKRKKLDQDWTKKLTVSRHQGEEKGNSSSPSQGPLLQIFKGDRDDVRDARTTAQLIETTSRSITHLLNHLL